MPAALSGVGVLAVMPLPAKISLIFPMPRTARPESAIALRIVRGGSIA